MRIKGWMGRADQTTKIKGMFVRPEQVAALVAKNDSITKARVIVSRENESDIMTVQVESEKQGSQDIEASVLETLKMRGTVIVMKPGSLPNDGKVIEDQRSYE
jgi:phenylacetate-CoA ligase